jgi:hypothetical protein
MAILNPKTRSATGASADCPPERGCVQSTSRSTMKGSKASGIFSRPVLRSCCGWSSTQPRSNPIAFGGSVKGVLPKGPERGPLSPRAPFGRGFGGIHGGSLRADMAVRAPIRFGQHAPHTAPAWSSAFRRLGIFTILCRVNAELRTKRPLASGVVRGCAPEA